MFSLLDPLLVVELLMLGLCTGFLAGLLGIGGGMLMVPFVTFILTSKGFPPEHIVKMAVATSLATICFTSLSSVWAHHKRGAVLWPVALTLGTGHLGRLCFRRTARRGTAGQSFKRAFRRFRRLFSHADVFEPQTQTQPRAARQIGHVQHGRTHRCAGIHRRRGWRVHLCAIHDLEQRQNPQRRRHLRRAGLSHRFCGHAGLHLGWLELATDAKHVA